MNRQEPHAGSIADSNEEKLHTFLDQAFPELQIIGPRKEDVQRFSALETPGIRVKLGRSRETLVYELRVPLKKTSEHPFAIDPIAGHRLGIEFETGEFKPEQMKSGAMHAGGRHGRGERMSEGDPANEGGFGGGMPPGGGRDQGEHFGKMEKAKQMELWLSVQLAGTAAQ
jgi:hypothetical protein